MMQLEVMCL